jgi:hypothetical protein
MCDSEQKLRDLYQEIFDINYSSSLYIETMESLQTLQFLHQIRKLFPTIRITLHQLIEFNTIEELYSYCIDYKK